MKLLSYPCCNPYRQYNVHLYTYKRDVWIKAGVKKGQMQYILTLGGCTCKVGAQKERATPLVLDR